MSEDGENYGQSTRRAPRRIVSVASVQPSIQAETDEQPNPEAAAISVASGSSSDSDSEREETDQPSPFARRRNRGHQSVRLNRPLQREVEPSVIPWSHGSFRLSREYKPQV